MLRIIPAYFLGIASVFCLYGQLKTGNAPKPPDAALRDAQAVVVGDIVSGQSAEANHNVTVTAVLRVRRSLSGTLQPGADIQLAWNYQTRGVWPATDTQTVQHVTGLWLLCQTDSTWTPAPVGISVPGAMGGVYIPTPAAPLPVESSYAADAPLDEKFVREIGVALSAYAAQHTDQLKLEPTGQGYRLRSEGVQLRRWFDWLWRLRPEAALPVFHQFATSSDANLKGFGLAGRIRQGDPDALTAVEQNLPALVNTIGATQVAHALTPKLLRGHPETVHVLGRLVLAETPLPNFEGLASTMLGSSQRLEALPYLVAMLDHPDQDTRSRAVGHICQLLHTAPTPAGLAPIWDAATMSSQCPTHAPLADSEQVENQVRFWKNGYAARRDELFQLPGMAEPRLPTWYLTAQRTVPRPISKEERFRLLVLQYGSWEKRQAEQPDTAVFVLPGLRLSARDSDALRAILKDTDAQMKAWQQQMVDQKEAARRSGRPLDPAATAAWVANGKSIVTAALDEARRTLSADGWAALEHHMNEMGISGGAIPANRAPGGN